MDFVRHFEQTCLNLSNPANPLAANQAKTHIAEFQESFDAAERAQQVLEHSEIECAQQIASIILVELVTRPTSLFTFEQRYMLREFAFGILSKPRLQLSVVKELARLIARITKISWLDTNENDDLVFQDVVMKIDLFLENGNMLVGATLYSELVQDMNRPDQIRGLTRHRKIAMNFRETCLQSLFQRTLEFIRSAWQANAPDLMAVLLQIIYFSLTYDFIGTYVEETTEDVRTIQVPSAWKDMITGGTLNLFFDVYATYATSHPSVSSSALQCLTLFAQTRRTIFPTSESRNEFTSTMLGNILNVLSNNIGLTSSKDNYHEFCRLVSRLRGNYQLGELIAVECYEPCIRLLGKFTVDSIEQWEWSSMNNSLYYLLGLFEKLIAAVPFTRSVSKPHHLDELSTPIVNAYIGSKMAAVEAIIERNLENPLSDEDLTSIETELKQFAIIARCQFQNTFQILMSHFNPRVEHYSELLAFKQQHGSWSSSHNQSFQTLESQLTFLTYMIAYIIGSRTALVSSNTDDTDTIDGQLISSVLQFLKISDDAFNIVCSEFLDAAFVTFLQLFRVNFVGDQLPKTSKLFVVLAEIGLGDEPAILDFIIRKLTQNLQTWASSERILKKTLDLLNELTLSYTMAKKMVKLESVQHLVHNHAMPFLSEIEDTRFRTQYYNALGKFLLNDTTEENVKLEPFFFLFNQTIADIRAALFVPNPSSDVMMMVTGLVRDLRGVGEAFITKPSFNIFFDWLYPEVFEIMHRGLELWFNEHHVAIPILKFMNEVCKNDRTRIGFGISSPNEFILFREMSKMLITYGRQIVTVENAPDIYRSKYKGIMVCFEMLRNTLVGDYVNFGVFRLYEDPALYNALTMFFTLSSSIPLEDLAGYQKVHKAYYAVLDQLTKDHIDFFPNLDLRTFSYTLESIREGLKMTDTVVSTQSCKALDNILSHIISPPISSKLPSFLLAGVNTNALLQESDLLANKGRLKDLTMHNLAILGEIMASFFHTLMYEDCRNQWSLSRPLLCLIILCNDFYFQTRENIIQTFPPAKQPMIAGCFDRLLVDVDSTLVSKNREHFTQNVAYFRRDITSTTNPPSSGGGRLEGGPVDEAMMG